MRVAAYWKALLQNSPVSLGKITTTLRQNTRSNVEITTKFTLNDDQW